MREELKKLEAEGFELVGMKGKHMNWPALHGAVRALEEEFWHADGGVEKLEADDEYVANMLEMRWANIGRPCKLGMEDVTFKELIMYYHFLIEQFDHYDAIPEYEEAKEKFKRLRDQVPSGWFVETDAELYYATEKVKAIHADKYEKAEREAHKRIS